MSATFVVRVQLPPFGPIAVTPSEMWSEGKRMTKQLVLAATTASGGATNLVLTATFEDLFDAASVNDLGGENFLEEAERMQGWIAFPSLSTDRPPFDPIRAAFEVMAQALRRVAVRSRCPDLIAHLERSYASDDARASLTVRGKTYEFVSTVRSASVHRDVRLSRQQIEDACNSPAHPHELFLLLADHALHRGDLRGAIVNLVTGLEIAAYAFERRENPGATPMNFSAKAYFDTTAKDPAPGARRYATARAALPRATYESIDSLVGTRHEVVHNGASMRRPHGFDKKTGTPDLRALVFDDYVAFRKAVSETLVWLGFPSMEA